MKSKFTDLEIALFLRYANHSSCCIKAINKKDNKTFWLIFYEFPSNVPRPAVKLPIEYWSKCRGEERRIGEEPADAGYTWHEHPYSYWPEDRFYEATTEQLIEYFNRRN